MFQPIQSIIGSAVNTVQNSFSVVVFFDIAVVAVLVYAVIMLVRQTNTWQMAKGILIVIIIYFLAYFLQMSTLMYLMESFTLYGIIAMVVVFQPELRRALELMGRTGFARVAAFAQGSTPHNLRDVWTKAVVEICDTAENLSGKKTGALIVLERSSNLDEIIKTGTMFRSTVNSELLDTIFYDGSPLHDGAVVVRNGHIEAAGCLLPLSNNLEIGREMGTRHRAALGMSENSDAVVVVVSEETGIISCVKNGVLIRRLERQSLYKMLESDIIPPKEETKKQPFWSTRRRSNDEKTDEQ